MKPRREITIDGQIARIPLTRGFEAKIDIADIPLVDGLNWTALVTSGKVYAFRQVSRPKAGTMIYLHRLIMAAKQGDTVDHISGDSLDNTRSNLRLCTVAQNIQNAKIRPDNTSGFKGVSWHKGAQRWVSYINKDGVRTHLGTFIAKSDAIAAVMGARGVIHGEFARHE